MPGRVAIVQSSYVPWRGAFALIARCDAFVFLDSVQFTRRDWRTRNRIRTAQGLRWLSVPVRQKGNYVAPIDAIAVADPAWPAAHLRLIEEAYRRAPGFAEAILPLRAAYAAAGAERLLSAVNRGLTAALCGLLGIATPLLRDVDLLPRTALEAPGATDRLVALARAAGADRYLSGPSARAYLDEAAFARAGIAVEWMSYAGLPDYPQLHGGFEPSVSILDALLVLGPARAREALGG